MRHVIKCVKRDNHDSFKKFHKQLKPLHGHPNNKHLLDEIDGGMNEMLENLFAKISIELEPLKVRNIVNYIQIFFMKYTLGRI